MSIIYQASNLESTAYPNQRKIDRCQNGVIWTITRNGGFMVPAYSIDEGATWVGSTAFNWGFSNGSFFIDLDDYAHLVYLSSVDSRLYYRRGTPNGARTAWTWSDAFGVYTSAAGMNYPDIIAHREGTGWRVHIVSSYPSTGGDKVWRYNIHVSPTGVLTMGQAGQFASGSYGSSMHSFPSIDFNHTGDGKTIKNDQPDVYVVFSGGTTGVNGGIRFRKMTHSAGSWNLGTERTIDSTLFVNDFTSFALSCFDGTRVIIPGRLYDGTNIRMVAHERDAADTSTVLNQYNGVTDKATGSATVDRLGNTYMAGREGAGGGQIIRLAKIDRVAKTFTNVLTLPTTTLEPWVSMKRGTSGRKIELVYTSGTSPNYDVTYASYSVGSAPAAPVVTVNSLDATSTINISWVHSDADGDTQQAAKIEVRKLNAELIHVEELTSVSSINIPAYKLTSGEQYQARVKTADLEGFGPWSGWTTFETEGRKPGIYVYSGTELVLAQEIEVTS